MVPIRCDGGVQIENDPRVRSSAASDVYKRQVPIRCDGGVQIENDPRGRI